MVPRSVLCRVVIDRRAPTFGHHRPRTIFAGSHAQFTAGADAINSLALAALVHVLDCGTLESDRDPLSDLAIIEAEIYEPTAGGGNR